METVTELQPGLWHLSLPFQGEQGIVGCYLLRGEGQVVLLDPGPGSTLDALLTTLRSLGINAQEITHILLTHIHLDHAGSCGSLLQHTPGAKVYVHGKGAPHLLDPTKFIASASRIFGEQMQTLWGEMKAVPFDAIKVIEGGDLLSVAGRQLEVHYTPGHAIHHIVFFDSHSKELFSGDVAGVRLEGVDYVRPPTPPPDLDLGAWYSSIEALRHLNPSVLYLAHFGALSTIETHLNALQEKLQAWGEITLQALREGKNEREIIELLIARTQPELEQAAGTAHEIARYELATNYAMTAQGYIRYWQKKHRELLQ